MTYIGTRAWLDAAGPPVAVQITTPATGVEPQVIVPDNTYYRLLSVAFDFVSSAVVANRYIRVGFSNAIGNNFNYSQLPTAVTASLTGHYSMAIGQGAAVAPQAIRQSGPIPDLVLPPGYAWNISVPGIDVGDQVQAIYAFIQSRSTG
ncbi:MAG: hypothetical protein ACRDPY_33645 [Streptosporangiaceae bacterium]